MPRTFKNRPIWSYCSTVKHVLNVAIHLLHIGVVINTTAYPLGRYSRHLHLLKSSMIETFYSIASRRHFSSFLGRRRSTRFSQIGFCKHVPAIGGGHLQNVVKHVLTCCTSRGTNHLKLFWARHMSAFTLPKWITCCTYQHARGRYGF